MVPPFLAVYGAIQRNITLMDEAYSQIKLYRDALRDDSGLWKHIIGDGDGLDAGALSTVCL
jgi:rhamnogalacturonyl hydrolase YesR